jgi:hypothetical protein
VVRVQARAGRASRAGTLCLEGSLISGQPGTPREERRNESRIRRTTFLTAQYHLTATS